MKKLLVCAAHGPVLNLGEANIGAMTAMKDRSRRAFAAAMVRIRKIIEDITSAKENCTNFWRGPWYFRLSFRGG